jgi:hypothetical protein
MSDLHEMVLRQLGLDAELIHLDELQALIAYQLEWR